MTMPLGYRTENLRQEVFREHPNRLFRRTFIALLRRMSLVVSLACLTRTHQGFAAPVKASTQVLSVVAPPYDLELDRSERARSAKAELGRNAHTIMVSPVFVLAGPRVSATQGAAPFIQAVLAAYMNGRFKKVPEKAISIYIFPELAAYHGFCRKQYDGKECISRFGFYEPSERRIIMNGGADGTLSHELVHPFVEADFPAAPTWLNEGIASLYEAPVLYKKGEIRGAKNWRLPRLKAALASARERASVSLEALFAMTDEEFRCADEDLHYAMARYACQWLEERGQLWDFYHAYRDSPFEVEAPGVRAFASVVGTRPNEASKDWLAWLRKL